ncbi:amidohydrolase family protein, partial [Rhizobiaceae sp. 2RAB30]
VKGADGSLASSMRGMDWMVRTMAKAVGHELHNVIRMASLTPAKLAGVADEVGSIEPGKLADIVVLGPELDVRRVFIGAEPVLAA